MSPDGAQFKSRKSALEHMINTLKSPETDIAKMKAGLTQKCKICKKIFQSSWSLARHIKRLHKVTKNKISSTIQSSVSSEGLNGKKSLNGKEFSSLGEHNQNSNFIKSLPLGWKVNESSRPRKSDTDRLRVDTVYLTPSGHRLHSRKAVLKYMKDRSLEYKKETVEILEDGMKLDNETASQRRKVSNHKLSRKSSLVSDI